MITTFSLKKTFPLEIDLNGVEGNAFNLMTHAKKLAYLMGLSEEEEKAILDEMRAGDYENLIRVFDKYFGEYVILYR